LGLGFSAIGPRFDEHKEKKVVHNKGDQAMNNGRPLASGSRFLASIFGVVVLWASLLAAQPCEARVVKFVVEQTSTFVGGAQWLLWDTGYADALSDKPVTSPVGTATRRKTLASQLAEIGVKATDIQWVAVSHTHAVMIPNAGVHSVVVPPHTRISPGSTRCSTSAMVTSRLPTCSVSWPGPCPRTSAEGE